MNSFIVSARKYRPRHFDDVIGQQAIANTLKRAIINHKLAGAYLFCGPRGVGKTTCARIFAKAINCLNPQEDGEACNVCESCKSFDDGRSVNVQELNAAANNSVEDIRAIIDQVRIPPQLGKYKVIILDEVHMLSQSASNALLKTLEEPPSYVIFILATTEKQKIIPTILSRCQIFDFNRMEVENIITELKMVAENEGIEYEDSALNIIAKKADGGMRDSLSIFDQVVSFSGGKVTVENVSLCLNILDYEYYFKMTEHILNHDVTKVMLLYNEIVTKGFDGGVFISGLASHFRDILVSKHQETTSLLDASNDVRTRYSEQATKCPSPFLYKAIRLCERCGNEYKFSYNKRLSVEITLIEVAQIGTDNDTDDDGSGRGPEKKLKPIFKNTNKKNQVVAKQPAAKVVTQPEPSQEVTEPKKEPTPEVKAEDAAPAKKVVKKEKIDPSLILKKMGSFSIHSAMGDVKTPLTQPETNEQPPVVAEQNTDLSDDSGMEEEKVPVEMSIGLDPFTDVDLNMHWMLFADNLPQEHKDLQGRMQGMMLGVGPSGQVQIFVNNDEVSKFMKPIMPKIVDYLKKELNNREITYEFVVRSEEEQQVEYNPSKLFKQMLEESPALNELNKQLGLKID